jgi:signal transduction histidine kinase
MARRWRALTRSTTAGFMVLVFLLQFAVTVGALFFVQQASQRALAVEQRDLVYGLRDELIAADRTGGRLELVRLINARVGAARGGTSVILLATPDGRPIVGNLDAWPSGVSAHTDWRTITLYRTGSEQPEHIGLAAERLPDGTRLLAGHVIELSLRLARANWEAILAAMLAAAALAFLSAVFFGRLLSRRIDNITDTAAAVGDGALARRVKIGGSGDAFDGLGRSINAMLERIETLITQLRLMTDGLAHDLRSPVTRLRSVIERASQETNDDAARAALEVANREVDRLLGMLGTALLIGRAEAGIGRDHFAETSIAGLLHDLAEVYGPLAEERGFVIQVDAPQGLVASLHRELVSQAVANLIDNALNHAEGGSLILLAATATGGRLEICVADNGPGVPTARRADALKRFGRLNTARGATGSGLGLPLVAAVAKLHGGTIALQDNEPGLRVVFELVVA